MTSIFFKLLRDDDWSLFNLISSFRRPSHRKKSDSMLSATNASSSKRRRLLESLRASSWDRVNVGEASIESDGLEEILSVGIAFPWSFLRAKEWKEIDESMKASFEKCLLQTTALTGGLKFNRRAVIHFPRLSASSGKRWKDSGDDFDWKLMQPCTKQARPDRLGRKGCSWLKLLISPAGRGSNSFSVAAVFTIDNSMTARSLCPIQQRWSR